VLFRIQHSRTILANLPNLQGLGFGAGVRKPRPGWDRVGFTRAWGLCHGGAMGRKAGVMHVNPKSLMRKTMTCMQEILVFLACIQKFNYDDDKCAAEKRALNMCMELQVILSFRNAVQFSRSRACVVVERIRVLRSLEALESM
jgi:hypothetical protein